MYKNQWICIAQCSSFPKTALSTLSISLAAVASGASYTAAGAGPRCCTAASDMDMHPLGRDVMGNEQHLSLYVCTYVCI
jgi:hypothetical protein